jgi:hypothetical protein
LRNKCVGCVGCGTVIQVLTTHAHLLLELGCRQRTVAAAAALCCSHAGGGEFSAAFLRGCV